MSNLLRFEAMKRDQPIIMRDLLMGETVDLSDGLTARLNSSKLDTMNDQCFMDIEFFLEGRSVGSLDHSWGGHIEGVDEDNWELFEKIVHKMGELFPEAQHLLETIG